MMSCCEVDSAKLSHGYKFCVYLHKRPDGSVFYVGKGIPRRAYDFNPSRRNLKHRNIVAKHGRENIGIQVIPCAHEFEAFALEKVHISIAKAFGSDLANLTDGGEGAAGHVANQAQRAALAKGRLKGKPGKPGRRPHLEAWLKTSDGIAHLKRLSEIGKLNLHKERTVVCHECGSEFTTKSAVAKCCSRLCEQRYRRAGKNK